MVIAIIYALFLRLIVNPERYKGSHKSQAVMVLLFIFTIMVTLLVMNGIRINLGAGSAPCLASYFDIVGDLFRA